MEQLTAWSGGQERPLRGSCSSAHSEKQVGVSQVMEGEPVQRPCVPRKQRPAGGAPTASHQSAQGLPGLPKAVCFYPRNHGIP